MSEIWQYRDLLFQLVRREIVVRYRHSLLGAAWALLQPLGLMLLFTFVFTRAVAAGALNDLGVPYAIWAYVGILPWTLFAAGLGGAVLSLAAHRDMVTKVYFPRQILPMAAVASAFFDFLVASTLLAGLAVYYRVTCGLTLPLGAPLLWLAPLVIFQLLIMLGLGMWLALANLWYRDVKYLFNVGIQMWMFLTNVLYPLPENGGPVVRGLTLCNPMIPIISGYRRVLLEGRAPEPLALLGAATVGAMLTAGAWAAYRLLEGRFAERA